MRRILISLIGLAALFPSAASAGTLETCQTALQYLNSPGVLYFLGGLAVIGGLGLVLSKIVDFSEMSANTWGVLGCLLAAALMSYAFWAPTALTDLLPKDIVVFIGALVFAPSLAAALSGNDGPSWILFAIYTAVYAGLAVGFTSSLIGFLAVLSFVGLLGFTAFGGGLSYSIGFESEDKIPGATIAGILLAGAFSTLKVNGISIPQLSVFEGGAFWVGTFVAGVGVLITSSKWYGGSGKRAMPYVVRQIAALGLFAAGIYAGIAVNDGALLYIATAFAMLFIIEKLYEATPEGMLSRGLLTTALGITAIIGGNWLVGHMDAVQAFIHSIRV